jgi:pilus assembly protein CpaF
LTPAIPLLRDDSITEILINGPDQVYIERNGILELTDIEFRDTTQLMRIVDRIVSPLGRRVDESSPLVDARLPDGSRVNIIIPPLSLVGPCISIRKFAKAVYTAGDMIRLETLTEDMVEFLRACVIARLNIVVSGGTSTGKTTMLNVLSGFLPENERIVTIEDAAELQLNQEHLVRLESRPPNVEGRGEITIRSLVINALRMRPDRIVVGEVRGGEALDMLQAMNTGHDGSLTTAHSRICRCVPYESRYPLHSTSLCTWTVSWMATGKWSRSPRSRGWRVRSSSCRISFAMSRPAYRMATWMVSSRRRGYGPSSWTR